MYCVNVTAIEVDATLTSQQSEANMSHPNLTQAFVKECTNVSKIPTNEHNLK